MKYQRESIKRLFESRPGQPIPVYELAQIALQYNARVYELKHSGMNIKNEKKLVNGQWHTWFTYYPAPTKVEASGQLVMA